MRIVAYRGYWYGLVRDGHGQRCRISLGRLRATPENRQAAERAAEALARDLARPTGNTIDEIMAAYLADTRALHKGRMADAWKALKWHFAPLIPAQVTRETCRAYTASRREEGRADGTIRKELMVLSAALHWHDKKTPAAIEAPLAPPPRERWLTRDEFAKLLKAAEPTFHLTVFLHLAIATAGRKEAILGMTWPQVRFDDGLIFLGMKPGGKERSTVPMTPTLRAVLATARDTRQTERVVEYAGRPVASIRTAFAKACERAKLDDVTPHVIRHTAATWMAQAGVGIEEIARYLGHKDPRLTWRVYAKWGPGYLAAAARAVDVGQCTVVHVNHATGTERE